MIHKLSNTRPIFRQLVVIATVIILWTLKAGATISVHDVSENTSTGVYTYLVTLDGAANVQTNDGFVIYDFPGLSVASISGGLSTTQFSVIQQLTSNSLTKSASVNTIAGATAAANGIAFDSGAIDNLSFEYIGPPVPLLGATTATLTLTSSVHGADTTSVYGSVDHSGPSSLVPYSFASNPVIVPTVAVPEPATLTLLAACGVPLMARRRKRAA
jgi:hypothetical protein